MKGKCQKFLSLGETNKKVEVVYCAKWVRTMAINEKISKSLKSAITYLENSIIALNKGDENYLADNVWHVAAELEYTLFLFSLTLQTECDKSGWKPNPEPKKFEIGQTLALVQDLLDKAEKSMVNEEFLDVYRNAYVARHYVFKIQEDFARKKREVLKGK